MQESVVIFCKTKLYSYREPSTIYLNTLNLVLTVLQSLFILLFCIVKILYSGAHCDSYVVNSILDLIL